MPPRTKNIKRVVNLTCLKHLGPFEDFADACNDAGGGYVRAWCPTCDCRVLAGIASAS